MWGWPPSPAACVLLSLSASSGWGHRARWLGVSAASAAGGGDPSVVRSRVGVVSGRGQLVGRGDSSLEEKGLPCLSKGGCSGPPDLGTCGWLMGDENLVHDASWH